MSIFQFQKKQTPKNQPGVSSVQTARGDPHPFRRLSGYMPARAAEHQLYRELREAVPVIDAAIAKIVRLTGEFEVQCADPEIGRDLNSFLKNVRVSATGRGIYDFISVYLDQLLTYGTAVGEIVPDRSCGSVAALYNAPLCNIDLAESDNALEAKICVRQGEKSIPVRNPNLICLSLLSPEPGTVRGTSLLKGLPFVSDILMKIYQTVGINFERLGNLRFAVTYKPTNDAMDRAMARDRAQQIAGEWSKTMDGGNKRVRDFVAVGDVQIKVIGADNQTLDTAVPVRQMLEQIVAKTGLPPFLLGLSWSTTERMSVQQADILTSELEFYRRVLEPVIQKICGVWLNLRGVFEQPHIEWAPINLLDEVEVARARLINAQAMQIEQKLGIPIGIPLSSADDIPR